MDYAGANNLTITQQLPAVCFMDKSSISKGYILAHPLLHERKQGDTYCREAEPVYRAFSNVGFLHLFGPSFDTSPSPHKPLEAEMVPQR